VTSLGNSGSIAPGDAQWMTAGSDIISKQDDGPEVPWDPARRDPLGEGRWRKSIREPIAWHGPFVMNTDEELRLAFEEFENGTFVKSPQA
jgi:redox-sensitive bicupin YhaK (pirin superfamily)